jgi:predicted SAM-dependent methyltransferase
MTFKQRVGSILFPRLPVTRRTFDLFRFELNAAVTRVLVRVSPRYRRRRRALTHVSGLLVNLGSGGQGHPGWVNVDVMRHHSDQSLPWDLRRSLPFRDGQVALVFAEHVLEHLEFREEVPRLLRELHRVLAPGGRVRIIVPDGERWLRAYASDDPAAWAGLGVPELPADTPTRMALVNHVFHQHGEHYFAYDFETLTYVLAGAGFTTIERRAFRDSGADRLAIDQAHHAPYSLYVEAEK